MLSLALGANIIGMIGSFCVVIAYLLTQTNHMNVKGLPYNLLNLLGAICLLLSLLVHFNLASFIIEVFWISASLLGLYFYCKNRR